MQSEHRANFVQHPIDTRALGIAKDQKEDLSKSHFSLSLAPQEKYSSTMRSDIGVFKQPVEPIVKQQHDGMNRHRKSSIQFAFDSDTEKMQSESRAWFVKHPTQPHEAVVKASLTLPSILLGYDKPLYQSTSEAALQQGQSSKVKMTDPNLAKLKVAELRKTHINTDPCDCDFKTDYSSSFVNHGASASIPSITIDARNSINLGQHPNQYNTESRDSYSQFDKLADACKQTNRATADNYRSGFRIGSEQRIPMQSESRDLFVDHIKTGVFDASCPIVPDKSSHLSFGPTEPTPASIARDSYRSHCNAERLAAFKPNLVKSNWALGDDEPPKESIEREMMRYASKHAPVTAGAARGELRGSHFVLGFEPPHVQLSTAAATLVNHPGAVPGVLAANVKADLRKAHFDIGAAGNTPWTTTTGDMLQLHGLCRAELDPEMKRDLRASHFSTAAHVDDGDRRVSLSHASFKWPA